MSKTNLILAVLAAVQVIVLIVVKWTGGTAGIKDEARGPLLSFDIETVFRIEIDDGDDDREVVLERSDAGWVVASEEGYPANATKIDQGTGVLNKLAKVELRRPVLRKIENQAPVKVADDAYARRIILKDAKGKELGRYYVAPGSSGRAAYLRRGGDDPVFETQEISAWELGTYPSSWLDTTYLDRQVGNLKAATVKLADGSEWRFERREVETPKTEGEASVAAAEPTYEWWLAGAEAQRLDRTKVESKLRAATRISLSDVLGKQRPAPEDVVPEGIWTLEFKDQDAPTVVSVLKVEGESPYAIQASTATNADYWVGVSQWAAKPLIEVKLEELQEPKPEPKEDD